LETNNVILRKHYHKYATHALQAIVKIYPTVSFNQLNQVFFNNSTFYKNLLSSMPPPPMKMQLISMI